MSVYLGITNTRQLFVLQCCECYAFNWICVIKGLKAWVIVIQVLNPQTVPTTGTNTRDVSVAHGVSAMVRWHLKRGFDFRLDKNVVSSFTWSRCIRRLLRPFCVPVCQKAYSQDSVSPDCLTTAGWFGSHEDNCSRPPIANGFLKQMQSTVDYLCLRMTCFWRHVADFAVMCFSINVWNVFHLLCCIIALKDYLKSTSL